MTNKKILHYKIIEKLGEGGMGIVYLAEDTKLKRQVAIKFLPNHIASNSDERKRFEIEAQAAAALNHPNIATIHNIEESDNELFLVMEYISGKHLKDHISSKPLPVEESINIAIQIAEGLQAAHKKGIVHRDIKSANIMSTEDEKIKIMDFGLAKISGGAQFTKEQSTLGTAAYMSPEQARGEEVDHRTDIWSFGVVLYEMLTGHLPFKGDYEQAIIYSILNEDPPSLIEQNRNLPDFLISIILKSLEKDINKRYQKVSDILDDLRNFDSLKTSADDRESPKKAFFHNKRNIALVVFFVVVLSTIVFLIQKETIRQESTQLIKKNHPDRLAILPFGNLRPDPDTDYLGYAIANQIIGELVYLKNITVRPASSVRKYDKKIIDPNIVGNELNVDYLLIGDYLKAENVIRLNIELVEVNSGEMTWRSNQIEVDYSNVFELQDVVAKRVVQGLNVQFTQSELNRINKDIPENPLAYEYYLRGLSFPLSRDGNKLAIGMLEKSIELDSMFAPAFVQLGDRIHRLAAFGEIDILGYHKAEKIFQKAISLNKESVSALAHLASVYTETGRINEAAEFIKKALKINPKNADALFYLGYIYRYAGMDKQSIMEMEKAILIDPGNPRFRSLSLSYFNLADYEKALSVFEKVETSDWVTGMKGYILFRQGKNDRAIEIFNQIISKEPNSFWGLISITSKAIIQRDIEKGLEAMQKRERMNITDAEPWYYAAVDYALLGDKEGCIRSLKRAVEGGYFNYPLMLNDSFLDSVRGNPEFKKVLEIAKEKHLAFKTKFFPEKS